MSDLTKLKNLIEMLIQMGSIFPAYDDDGDGHSDYSHTTFDEHAEDALQRFIDEVKT